MVYRDFKRSKKTTVCRCITISEKTNLHIPPSIKLFILKLSSEFDKILKYQKANGVLVYHCSRKNTNLHIPPSVKLFALEMPSKFDKILKDQKSQRCIVVLRYQKKLTFIFYLLSTFLFFKCPRSLIKIFEKSRKPTVYRCMAVAEEN